MARLWGKGGDIGAAKRGQIVQRVLVDGWTAAQAGSTFGVSERRVARWVAAYRRHGMASLRENAAERPHEGWPSLLWARLRRHFGRMHRRLQRAEPAECVVLRRDNEIRHRL